MTENKFISYENGRINPDNVLAIGRIQYISSDRYGIRICGVDDLMKNHLTPLLFQGTKEECDNFLENLKSQFPFLSYKNGLLNLNNILFISSRIINRESNRWSVEAYAKSCSKDNRQQFILFQGTEKECKDYLIDIDKI